MHKIVILFVIVLLGSCSLSNNEEEQGFVEETGEILTGYVDTMKGSIENAKKVQELSKEREKEFTEMQKAIK